MTDTPRETQVLEAVVSLVDNLLDDFDVVELLTELTEHWADLLDIAAAGFLLADPLGQLRLLAATSKQTRELELFQLQADEGPCVECYATGQPVSVADLRAEISRWPRFVPAALEGGVAAVHAVPMRAAGIVLGSLGLFGARSGALNAPTFQVLVANEGSLGPPRWVAGLGGIGAVGCWSGAAWPTRLTVMAAVLTVNDVIDGQVGLDVECLDRIYLIGYVPNLQVGGQVVSFMTAHLGYPIPSPAILEKIGTAFRRTVDRFAADNHIPVVRFSKDDRKVEVMRPYLAAQARTGRSAVVAIGIAQEFQNVFASSKRIGDNGVPWFSFTKADRRVTCFYFYLWDADFGPAFIKVCAYFPYPIKVWLNGHEWAKRQATKAGIGFTELSNGFATCTDPDALQHICDRLGPGTITVFFERWMSRLPLPLTDADRQAGYWRELSMRQIEVARTLVFDAPRHARGFFEALVADNLDIGRPDSVEPIFHGPRRIGRPPKLDCTPKTKIVTRGTEVTVNAFYKHSRIKQYLKDGRALRIETVVNSPDDLRCQRRLLHLDELQAKARDVNRRLLDTERVGQGCVLASPAFARIAQPSLTEDGRRAPALRFGDPRVQALAGALCTTVPAVTGVTNKSLRALMTGLLSGTTYSMHQASYDLARCARNGLITRIPGRNLYRLTDDGLRFAIFYTKVHNRLLRPLLADNTPPAPPDLRKALRTIDTHVKDSIDYARLAPQAA